ncbi:hypothetical protein [Catellatospora vulcania]|uniref:hypothetical protein n=1 Tax=Catellatospora vulcania TaxID=1460450 RepID=UPI0012D3A729|nr:hypothetical protein [Catellatospora vulcania]
MSAPSFWVIADGTGVRLGDVVATEDGEGPIIAVTVTGFPIVEVTSGKRSGDRLGVRPFDILALVRRRRE